MLQMVRWARVALILLTRLAIHALMACVGCYPLLILLLRTLWDLVGRCPHPIVPMDCPRPFLLGYFSQGPLLTLLACVGRCPPSASKSAILVDPGGMFPSSDLAVTWDPAIPVGSSEGPC